VVVVWGGSSARAPPEKERRVAAASARRVKWRAGVMRKEVKRRAEPTATSPATDHIPWKKAMILRP
jgi:hypothetical protein